MSQSGKRIDDAAAYQDKEDLAQLKDEFADLMRSIHRERFSPSHESFGMSKTELQVLIKVGVAKRYGIEARPSDLAKVTCVSPSAVSQTLKALEGKGLITRARSIQDSRSVVIKLTEAGRRILVRTHESRSRFYDEMFSAVGVEDIRSLMSIMRKVLSFCESKKEIPEAGSECMDEDAVAQTQMVISEGKAIPCE